MGIAGIGGGFEGFRKVRPQPAGGPDAQDRTVWKAASPGHRVPRPIGDVGRRRIGRPSDGMNLIVPDGPRASRPG